MRIRSKLLIFFLLVSLAPLLLVWGSVRRDMTAMGESLADRSGNLLVHKASQSLERVVADHAAILHRERQLLEATARLLASRVEGILSGHEHMRSGAYAPPEDRLAALRSEYFGLGMSGARRPLDVDFARLTVESGGADSPLAGLAPVLGRVKAEHPGLLLWIDVALKNGDRARYPEARSAMMGGTMGMMGGGQGMMGSMGGAAGDDSFPQGLTWAAPEVDRVTGRMVFALNTPVRDAGGAVSGRLTLVVPVDAVLHEESRNSPFPEGTESLLVAPATDPDTREPGLRIVARERAERVGMGHMWIPESDAWLTPEDTAPMRRMAESMLAGKPGVVGMAGASGSELWAFAPMDESGASLLLIVPEKDIVGEARAARGYVAGQVREHNAKMGMVVLAVALVVVLMAFFLSKLFTRNIRELAGAVRSVARGDFSVRVGVHSRDEVGQLAQSFNAMIPELRDKVRMQNSLEVAQEVQLSLLPGRDPEFPGTDIAGASAYSDETGGDYYDFIPRRTDRGDSLVVAVGDVSGHGVQAALTMASARAYLRSLLSGGAPLGPAVRAVNRLVFEDTDGSGRFMTLFLLELFGDGTMEWVRAGHDPALLLAPAGDRFEELRGEGLPLGVVPDADFTVGSGKADPGQVAVIGTDGIWEAVSPGGEMFGKDRFKALVRKHADQDAAGLVHTVNQAVTAFRATAPQRDDMTLAVVRWV
ncbi:Phosphoserine phosphatase RsbU [Pseudodesulfovibrio hydrargyri]|uniref:Phosphoserine phosphatase RsbU n=1 Tax=Pseudodesulfovibrio hydrargyri TaxID=2125990 RepID=A0A1J5NGQ9_9BACT|nr:SpoIIE family protein phosphatase [Pseudodesulfovibrio hydrargyri]OIQ52391.1 Phosphoserine phosphatase RsbU [Pseudodesulfovibrio hydrargyri]